MKNETENKIIKAKIFYYNFDIRTEKNEYENLIKLAREKSKRDIPDTHHYINGNMDFMRLKIKPLHNQYIHIETKYLFNNQFNTVEGFRLWFWNENKHQNANIKEGYYIETPDEFLNLLDNTFKCGYCGKQYFKPDFKTCNSCLDSEYLSKENLILLKLNPISKRNPIYLNETEIKEILPLYIESQINGNSKRQQKQKANNYLKIEQEYKKATETANIEYNGFKWLLDNNINIENCIYYNHTKTFCFGWNKPLSFELEQELKKQLIGFKFDYEIKVK